MGEKICVTIPIDEDIFFDFSNAVKQHGNGKSRYDILKYLMQLYIKKYKPNPGPPGPDPIALTEKLLEKGKEYRVGQLANIVLRRLLEKGVATDYEVTEFQKASGNVPVNRLEIEHGMYVNRNFGLPFPLLVTEEHYQYDTGNNFWVNPSRINGDEYYLCSQWVEGLHRKKLEAWIKKSLPEWFKRTDENSRNEMITWIEKF